MTKELKDEYWDVVKNTRIEDYINPVNLLEQKTIFEDNYKNATRYNPFFEYGQLRFQPKDTINKLKKIRMNCLGRMMYMAKFTLEKLI